MAGPVKLRMLKAFVVDGSSAATLTTELAEFFASTMETEAELVSVLRVADYKVLVLYTGTAG